MNPERARRLAVLLVALSTPALSGALSGQSTDPLSAAVQVYIDSRTHNSGIPGLTLGLALPDGTSRGFAAGWSDTTAHREMRATDRMLQGSVGKTYFGAVALQLVSEGRLDLDARLADYLGGGRDLERLVTAMVEEEAA
jgi:D-alanyl-D-alanine carboxypeptidase